MLDFGFILSLWNYLFWAAGIPVLFILCLDWCVIDVFFFFFWNVNQQRLPRYRQVWDQLWTVRATVKASLFPRRTPQSWEVACPGSFKSARERKRNGSGDCDFHQRGPSGPFGSGLGLELETSLLMWTCLLDLDSVAKRMKMVMQKTMDAKPILNQLWVSENKLAL